MRSKGVQDVIHCRASVEFLPPELLAIIFKLVHEKSYNPVTKSWYQVADLSSPRTFPYALASVCQIWRDIMSTVPEFWTRIIVFIDSNPSLSNLASHLEWSRDLLFQVTATRQSPSENTDDGEEAQVRKAVDILGPHLHRCSSLEFNVIYSSSLPSVYADILYDRVCPDLGAIIFNFRIGDGPRSRSRLDRHRGRPLPALTSVTLDGFNFVDLCDHHSDWLHGLREVSISHFTYSEYDRYTFSFYDAFLVLSDVVHLKLSSVDFTYDAVDDYNDLLPFSKLSSLELEDLSSELTRKVLLHCGHVNYVAITHCAIGEISGIELNAFQLILEDIPASGDLSRFLCQWSGVELTIRNCPGFNDSVLEKWSTRTSDDDFNSPLLSALTIHDCPNFSVELLKHLVEVRMEQCERSGGTEVGGHPPLSFLEVTGRRPLLSDEELKWFLKNVESFDKWETHQNA